MPKYLINEREAAALKKLVGQGQPFENLGWSQRRNHVSNFPFRFKTLENMGASVANSANAQIYFFGDSTDSIIETDYVVDDAGMFSGLASGSVGFCFASSQYFIASVPSTNITVTVAATTAESYICQATTDYASTDATFTLDNLEPMDGVGTTLTSISAQNSFNLASSNNGLCFVKYSRYSSLFEVLITQSTAAQPPAQSYMGLATTDYATTDATIVIDNLEAMDGLATTALTLTATNRFEWDINDNAPCYVKYNNHSSMYDLIQTKCFTQ